MALRKSNTYSKLVAGRVAGSEKEYTPESLWIKALEYFKWIEDNPMKEEKVFSSGKRITVNKIRAMTNTGFCVFAGIGKATYSGYLLEDSFANVISSINDVIYTQKFEAAAAGLLETGIVARELGLREQTDITSNGNNLHVEVVDGKTKTQLEKLGDS